MEKIILASQSPRRQEILSLGGYEYEVCVSSAEEQIPPEELENLTPQELVEKLARVKAEDVYRRNCSKNMEKSTTDNQAADSVEEITVIGADTVVAVDGCVLGKPKTEDEAKQMLARLSGRTHDVFTGVCILWTDSDTQEETNDSDVSFTTITKDGEVTENADISDVVEEAVAQRSSDSEIAVYAESGARTTSTGKVIVVLDP